MLTWSVGLGGCGVLIPIASGPSLRDLRIEHVAFRPPSRIHSSGLPEGRPSPANLLIHVSTDFDLSVYARNGSTFWSQAGLCREGRVVPGQLIGWSGLFDEGGMAVNGNGTRQAATAQARYDYTLTLPLRTERHIPQDSSLPRIEHDFRVDPVDICFYFSGGIKALAFPHRSADFRLPYSLVAQALARAGQPHAPSR